MADSNLTDCSERDPAGPAAQDAKAERAVLAFLINEHPNQLTIAEVSWALNNGSVEFKAEDAVECAVRELDGVGLLRSVNGFVVPTRAALYFSCLEAD